MSATLLFDLDGTLCETDWAHLKAFEIVFGELGIAMNEALFKARIMGASNPMIGAAFLPHLPAGERDRVLDHKEEVYRGLIGTVAPVAGLVDLLDWADAQGLACAIVTNAPRVNADLIIDGLGLRARFRAIVCGQELARGKPDPLPYLEGLRLLGGEARRSVAFEDSPSGMQAALGAGLALVGMTTNLDGPTVLGHGAGVAVRDFTDPAVREFVMERLRAA
ncbi:MAG TPA: HAD-IA family hydrolase [Beijerinckiaceae bacterium]|nr:HAD-IA family hydrolase [Beijerinckiaceae bacterium]